MCAFTCKIWKESGVKSTSIFMVDEFYPGNSNILVSTVLVLYFKEKYLFLDFQNIKLIIKHKVQLDNKPANLGLGLEFCPSKPNALI